MGVMGAVDVQGAGKVNTAVLAALIIILKIICLLSTSGLEVDPGEAYYFLLLIPDPPY